MSQRQDQAAGEGSGPPGPWICSSLTLPFKLTSGLHDPPFWLWPYASTVPVSLSLPTCKTGLQVDTSSPHPSGEE